MRFTRMLLLTTAMGLCDVQTAAAKDYDYIDPEAHTRVGVDYGLALGGTDLLDPAYTHGTQQNDQLVGAGDDEYLGLHLTQDLWHTRFAVQLAAAYGSAGDSGNFTCSGTGGNCRYSIQRAEYWAKLQYQLSDRWRVGVGRVFHRNIILESTDENNAFPNVDFRPAAGWMLELEARKDGLFAGVRLTHIMYHTVDTGLSANGNSVGFYIGLEDDLF